MPQNVPQLRSFLGLVNFYGKFLHNLADTLAPLHQLLRKNERWHWGQQQGKAFEKAKSQLTSPCVLTHFDPDKRLVLSCDASPYGLGAVLAHQFEDGSERLVAFASRSLAPAERKYSQIEKEGLAIVYGVKRFHQFLLGRHFMVYSDHKPLQYLFSESRPVPAMASARIQRWALTLSAYNYHIVPLEEKESGIEGDGTDAALPAPINQEDTVSEIEPDPLAEQERNDERPGEADEQEMDDEGAEDADEVQEAKVEQREVRRSNRQRHPPDRYRDYVWKLKGEECSDDVTSGVGLGT